VTLLWSVSQLAVAWSAVSHSRTGQKVGSLVQYMSNPLGAKVGYLFQCVYLLFWVGNTSAGVVGAILAMVEGAEPSLASSALLMQALFLVIGAILGLYNALVFASLYVHLDRPALFLQEVAEEEIEEQQQALVPRREFLKILEYFDLDEGGSLSQTLADLIISPYPRLVVDAFNLLVRTHESHKELHLQVSIHGTALDLTLTPRNPTA
jgi:hypothetical protein